MRRTHAQGPRVRLSVANSDQRMSIIQICTEVYERDDSVGLPATPWGLGPVLDQQSVYIIATRGSEVIGFIGITPPTSPRYALEAYIPRDQTSIPFDDHVYELRLLTVARAHQHSRLAALLMYAAFRWVEAQGGTRIIAASRRDNLSLFLHVGLRPAFIPAQSDAGAYVILSATVAEMRKAQQPLATVIERLAHAVDWELGIPFC